MDKELKEKIIDMHLLRIDRGDIVKALGVKYSSVVSAIDSYYNKKIFRFNNKPKAKKFGSGRVKTISLVLEENLFEIKKMIKKGFSVGYIADFFGASTFTVYKFLRKNKISTTGCRKDFILKVLELKKQGLTSKDIAKELGVLVRAVSYVRQTYRDGGLPRDLREKVVVKPISKNQLNLLKEGLRNG